VPHPIIAQLFSCGRRLLAACGLAVLVPALLAAQGPKAGYLLVANQEAASASLIDLTTDSMRLIPVGTGPHEAAISPSGRTGVVTIYGDRTPGNELAVIDIASGALTRTIFLGQYTRPHGVVFIPGDESRVAVTSEKTQRLVIVNLLTGNIEAAIPTGAQGSHMAAMTADGKRVFTSNVFSGSVSELDLVNRTLVRTIPVAPQVEGIAVTPDGSVVLAGSNSEGTVSTIATGTGAVTDTIGGFKVPYRLAVSADGAFAIVVDADGNAIDAIDVKTRKVLWKLDGLGGPRGVSIAPDGLTAFVTLADNPTVALVDLVSHQVMRTIAVGQSPDGVGYGPNPGH
jgi:YVTN family beta-propeller protein